MGTNGEHNISYRSFSGGVQGLTPLKTPPLYPLYITRRVQASGPSPHGASTVSYGFFICRFGPRGPTLSKHKIGQVRIYAYINMSQLRVVCQYEFFISVDVVWMPLLSPHVVVELLRIRSWEVGRCGAWQSFVVRTRECSLSHARPAAYVAERPCCSTTPRDTPQHGPRDTHPPRTETLYCKLLFYSSAWSFFHPNGPVFARRKLRKMQADGYVRKQNRGAYCTPLLHWIIRTVLLDLARDWLTTGKRFRVSLQRARRVLAKQVFAPAALP